ncbi:MAG TPA: transcription termination factor Rho [Jatrophihabitantaceae bacterium]|nr:transcription termination factor Rho [Jatrophihabitantaceae bacterium]
MTDIQEQAPAAAAADGAATAPAGGARAKRAALSTMLLPELKQLASGMGISTTKLKKSDLVAAIQAAQAGGSAAKAATSTAKTAKAPDKAADKRAAKNAAPVQPDTAAEAPTQVANGTSRQRPPRESRTANRATSADSADRAGQATDSGGAQQDRQQGAQEGTQHRQNGSVQRDGAQQDGTQQDGSRNRDNRQQDGRPQDRQQNNQNNQSNQSTQTGQGNQNGSPNGSPNQGGAQSEDDYDSRSRRGRRYRDRRGRNRERTGPDTRSGGGNDVEPTVADDDVLIPVAGILDAIEDKNTWFVRTEGYYASPDDVYVANSYVRKFNLRRGDAVTGAIRQMRDGERREKYNPLVRLDSVNGKNPDESRNRVEFTKLTPLYPQERLRLETEPHILTTRVIDLVMPIGKGQRALIVSPPKAGKTMVLQAIANAIATNNPEVHLMVVLVDERPEEVTDMQRSVKGEVIASTFDRKPVDHTTVAELSIERAKRLVEMGHDVVVLLDSITRLGRAYNLAAPASGRILSGGVDSTALYPPKRFLGAARNIENGGSLTILATALVETGSAGDTVIFEEFKGTGNAELKLDRKIADKRIFPAVDVDQSSTRKEEILLSPDELAVTIKLRRVLHELESQQAINLLLDRLRKTRTNIEFLMQIAKTTPGE